ncbi:DNA-protecting protein DprA [Acidiferrimicrobium sp. IK]|uniref:DNA-processing protein DprA n=1 Tax=Acidiferrimicrobium sp. IK TaxID=2871700 RepID=UPI0021CB11D3|nr:DNA-protecting protein DprA [Acidiferrimicrobium sp. IK]MCU4183760.1 DNA-protecting protein DprA [Acidiferrimicrobium sp. IK]
MTASATGSGGWRLAQGAYAGALAALPGMGPATLCALLERGAPADIWDSVRRGEIVRPPARGSSGGAGPRLSWAAAAAGAPLERWWDAWQRRGIGVTWPADPRYPRRLLSDPEPPGVLFWRGDLGRLESRCVAVVGTRRCSPDGRASAYDLGRDLAGAGVCVVSGLALGIDGAAHLGALDAPGAPSGTGSTVGVAASGVDVAYPARHAALWERVAAAGAVVSETPPGRPAQAWRFPARNRVIAGLVDMVVVVESHVTGGSLITADKAIDRGVEVRVVPGPVHAPFAAGSNQLLYDGPGPVRDAADVLDALGLVDHRPRRSGRRRPAPVARPEQLRLDPARPAPPPSAGGPAPPQSCSDDPPSSPPPPSVGPELRSPRPLGRPDGPHGEVLEAVGWRPTSLGRIVERAGRPVGSVGRILEELAAQGLFTEDRGWWQRTAGGGGRRE